MLVYYARNTVSGKLYVGQTAGTLEDRWKSHRKTALGKRQSRAPFHCAIRSYGPNVWELETICHADDQEQLDNLERAVIAALRTQDRHYGYNVSAGGNESPAKLPEVRAKISATLLGRKRRPEDVAKQLATRTASGYRHSPETRAKIAATNRLTKSKGVSSETRKKMSEVAKQRDCRFYTEYMQTPERRARRIAKLTGHVCSEETRRRIGEKSKLKTMSLAARQQTSASLRKFHAERNAKLTKAREAFASPAPAQPTT